MSFETAPCTVLVIGRYLHTSGCARRVCEEGQPNETAGERKLFGLQMQCLHCGEEWPCDKFFPEGTADGSTSLDALVYKFCIEPGCTRRCRYCAAGRTGDAHNARRLVEDKGCELCFKFFSSNEVHFTGEHKKISSVTAVHQS